MNDMAAINAVLTSLICLLWTWSRASLSGRRTVKYISRHLCDSSKRCLLHHWHNCFKKTSLTWLSWALSWHWHDCYERCFHTLTVMSAVLALIWLLRTLSWQCYNCCARCLGIDMTVASAVRPCTNMTAMTTWSSGEFSLGDEILWCRSPKGADRCSDAGARYQHPPPPHFHPHSHLHHILPPPPPLLGACMDNPQSVGSQTILP